MSLFVIGDTHLSLSTDKQMDHFKGWENYVVRLEDNWRSKIFDEDTVVIPGDICWGMSLQESLKDFQFLESLPGKKILLKGNHDYWWTTRSKAENFFAENGLTTISVLNNNAISTQGVTICGTRGWLFEQGEAHDKKIVTREAGRLRASIADAKRFGEQEKLVFLHYPPIFCNETTPELLEVLQEYNITQCYYGHIHADGCRYAFQGTWQGTQFHLVSADFLNFSPKKLK